MKKFVPQDGKQMGCIQLTHKERGLIMDAAQIMRAKLREDIENLYKSNPANTPLWSERVLSAKNLHDQWSEISEKVAIR
jgi:hypothetical protein